MFAINSVSPLAIGAFLAVAASSPLFAKDDGKLPENAVAMTSEQVKQWVSGHSIDWRPTSTYYFAQDGSVTGYFFGNDKFKPGFADGTWTVDGNEMCLNVTFHGEQKEKPYQYSNCNQFFKAKNIVWSKRTKSTDEDQYIGDIGTDWSKKLKAGDIVSAKANALKKKLGY